MTFRIIITYGTFDLLHHGHVRLLKRAREMGDFLIVGLSTDAFNRRKGKRSVLNYEQRKEVLQELDCVDMIIPERNWDQKFMDIAMSNAQMVMGSDWEGKFDKFNCLYIPRTEGISTTRIKKIINKQKI